MNGHYVGEVQGSTRHGQGICTDASGTYAGQWDGGLRSGSGIMLVCGGERYEGQWKNDAYEGHGKLTFANGSVFEGNFLTGQFKGSLDVPAAVEEAVASAASAKQLSSELVLQVGKGATQSVHGRVA